MPAGAEGLLFLPYLTGERLAEHTNSRAQFFGLQRKHRRGHLFRAVLEGVAFASWRNLRQLQKCGQYPQQMIASGGGARSSLWLEIKAAAYNLPILSTRNQENGVTGCGIIAGVGVGLYADFASGVRQTVQFDKVISPDPRLRIITTPAASFLIRCTGNPPPYTTGWMRSAWGPTDTQR